MKQNERKRKERKASGIREKRHVIQRTTTKYLKNWIFNKCLHAECSQKHISISASIRFEARWSANAAPPATTPHSNVCNDACDAHSAVHNAALHMPLHTRHSQPLCNPCALRAEYYFLLFSHSPASHCIFHFSVILHIKFFSSSSLWYFFLIIICIVIRLVAGKHNASQRGILIEFCRLRGIKKYQFEFNAATLETVWSRLRRTLSSRHRPNPILLFDCAMCLIKSNCNYSQVEVAFHQDMLCVLRIVDWDWENYANHITLSIDNCNWIQIIRKKINNY